MVQQYNFSHFHGSSFEDYFTTARKYRHNLMCSIEAYYRLYTTCNDYASSGGGRLLPNVLTTDAQVSLGYTLNFIGSWLQSFKKNIFSKQHCTVIKLMSCSRISM